MFAPWLQLEQFADRDAAFRQPAGFGVRDPPIEPGTKEWLGLHEDAPQITIRTSRGELRMISDVMIADSPMLFPLFVAPATNK